MLVDNATHHGTNVALDAQGNPITVNSGFFPALPAHRGPGLAPDKLAALEHCVGIDGDPADQIFGTLRGTFFDGETSAFSFGLAKSADGLQYIYGGGTG